MRSRIQAQVWELWHSSRSELLQIMGMQLVFLLLIGGLNFLPGGDDEMTQGMVRGLFVIMCMAVSVFSQSWRNSFESRHIGFSFHLGFTRPISTAQLVFVPMLYIVVAACTWYLVPALLYALVFRLEIPLLGPAMIVGCIVSCFVAIAWSTQTIASRAIGLVCFFVALIGSIVLFHRAQDFADPMLIAVGKPGYYAFTWYQILALFLASAVAIALTVVAVDRQRHGDLWTPIKKRKRRSSVRKLSTTSAFRGPVTAQIWYEMRRFGFLVLGVSIVVPLLALLAAFVGSKFYPESTWIHFWIVCMGASPLVYQLIGTDGAIRLRYAQGALQFSLFDAVRPLRNDQLIAIKMLLIAALSVIGFLGMAIAAGLHAWINEDMTHWANLISALPVSLRDVAIHQWISLACALVMLFFSSTSMLIAGGLWLPIHPKLFVVISSVFYGIVVLAMIDGQKGWNYSTYWVGLGWVFAFGISLGCIWSIKKALTSGFLSKQYFLAALGVWSIYFVTMIGVYWKVRSGIEIPVVAQILWLSGLLIPLATAAFAPLSLAEHRHG